MMPQKTIIQVSTVLIFSVFSQMSFGADTVETWAVGATDVDMYFGISGLGTKQRDYHAFGDMMLGYGITNKISVYMGTTLQSEQSFSNGSARIYLGLFGTPVDTEHFDLDLFFDVSLFGHALTQFQLGPALELNFDLDRNQQSYGFYLRAGTPIYGQSISKPEHPDQKNSEITYHFEFAVGSYWSVSDGNQLLVEFSMGAHPKPAPDERAFDVGGLALGYNVVVCNGVELINQLYLNIPQAGESLSAGIMIGFIATLPSMPVS